MQPRNLWLALALGLTLTACGGDNSSDSRDDTEAGSNDGSSDSQDDTQVGSNFELQLLHFADIDGAGGADDVDNFSALVDGFRAERPDKTVLLSSGDNLIPGPEFFAAGDDAMADVLGEPGNGRAHIAWLNAMGVAASVVGNHDLDAGTEAFTELLAADGDWPGAQFPYLSANIDFQAAADPDEADPSDLLVSDRQPVQGSSVAASATLSVDGETIGLVGASTPILDSITSTGGLGVAPADFDAADPADLDALAGQIQPAVDALRNDGIDKVILLAHMQQIAIEQALATRLEGVDIIVAGGSNTILADSNDRLRDGDTAADTYPLEFTSPADEPVLVVNTAGDFQYLGRLVVEFDGEGVIQPSSIDAGESGAFATDMLEFPFDPIADVTAITTDLVEVLTAKDGNVLGLTDVYLDGRRSSVRTEETNLGNLTADANLWLAQQADPEVAISLKNGGGIRSDIGQAVQPAGSNDPEDLQLLPPAANPGIGKPAGGISQLDLETSLRFNNGLTLLSVTAAELADIVEHAVSATADGATPGQFPQVGGLRFSFDPSRQARSADDTNQADVNINGNRLRSLAVVDDSGAVIDEVVTNGMVQGDPTRSFRLVILDFIAKCVGNPGESCGDGYPLKGLTNPQRVDVGAPGTDPGNADFAEAGSEQDALAEYLRARFPVGGTPFDVAETGAATDNRIQNLGVSGQSDTVAALPAADRLEQIGRFAAPGVAFDEGGAEIVAHDSATQRLFVINADAGTIDVLDFSDPSSPNRIAQLDPVADDSSGAALDGVNSVAVAGGRVAMALEADPATDAGRVGFYDAASLNFLGSVGVGPLPDMVAFARGGDTVLVANEGEVPEDVNDDELRDFSQDVPGSISVIDVSAGVGSATSTTLGFAAFNAGGSRAGELPDGVRINPNAPSVAADLEPEFVAVAEDGNTAYVSLQENNALAEVDLSGASPAIVRIIAMGTKAHGRALNALDASDDDDADGGDCTGADCINIRAWANLRGLYMPDSLDTFQVNGETFVITANEGDGRGEGTDECALKDQGEAGQPALPLDPSAFPDPSVTDDANLGELGISCDLIGGDATFAGDTDGDGDLDELRAFGARSVAIIAPATGVIGDTGDDFERITAHQDVIADDLFIFNDDNDDDSPERDTRSDAKGPEPEGVVTGSIGDRVYAFIGLERVGGIMMYDVSNPRMPRFVDYINNRDFTVTGSDLESGAVALDAAGDWGPEGLVFIPAAEAPTGQDLLVVGNEVTGTTTVYRINTP